MDYYGSAGVQHIALRTENVIESVSKLIVNLNQLAKSKVLFKVRNLEARGVEFLKAPATYYTDLAENLKKSKANVTEDLDEVMGCFFYSCDFIWYCYFMFLNAFFFLTA